MSAVFRDQLLALREGGDAVFPEFAAGTRVVWSRFARYLMRRWRGPTGVSLEDLEQELLLAGWQAVGRWDPARQVPIDRFVTFNSIDKAKKWLHKQRSAKRRDDNAPSRHALTFTQLGCEEAEDADRFAWVPGDAEERLLESEHARVMGDRITLVTQMFTRQERVCVSVIAECGGDLDAAVAVIASDPDRRLALRLGSDAAVENVVRRTARKVIDRLQANEGVLQ